MEGAATPDTAAVSPWLPDALIPPLFMRGQLMLSLPLFGIGAELGTIPVAFL